MIAGRVALCLSLMFATMSCGTVQEYVSENPRTAIGAGVGTLGGALIGGLVFDSAGAAVAGGLLGGLAGGLVGRALEHKNEDYEKTARDYAYLSEGRETILRVEEVDTDPARINPRERINLVARYAVLPPKRDQQVSVTEKWTIRDNVGNPTLTVRRPGGTWSSAIPITLPAGADPGTYEATVEVQAAGASDRGATTFRVS
jgi:outer membrane lipoprotein SlyB